MVSSPQVRELSGNGIAYLLNYSTNYMDLLQLRWQKISLSRQQAGPVYEIKEMLQFNPMSQTPRQNSEFVYEYTYGRAGLKETLGTSKIKFTSGDLFKASTVHPLLEGDAVILEGKRFKKEIVMETNRVVFLIDYGLVLEMEHKGAQEKMSYKITDLTID